MAISFNEVPANTRVPFVFAEFDAANAVAGPAQMPYKLLIIGQRRGAGTVAELIPTRVTSAAQARQFFGQDSMIADMARGALDNAPSVETWCVALNDLAAGTQAAGSITVVGTATGSGTLSVMVGGVRAQVGVSVGDTAETIASALRAAISATDRIPVFATLDGGTPEQINLLARHRGEVGNTIDLRLNYFQGEVLPEGVTLTIADMAGGAGNPDVTAAIDVLGDVHYNVIAHPYTDAANLAVIEAEMRDRFGPERQLEGVACTSATGTHGELSALGSARNSPHTSIIHASGVPTPIWFVAAAYAAQIAFHGQIDPARPFQTLILEGVLAPVDGDRFTMQENNLLLFDGIATFSVDAGGLVRIQRAITTYQLSANGAEDIAYLDVNTILTLGFLRFDFRNYILRKYPRHKLAGDTVVVPSGQAIMTPTIGRAEAIARFEVWQGLGLVEDIDQFKSEIICEIHPSDPNRLDWYLPPNLINQFRVGAAQIGFIL